LVPREALAARDLADEVALAELRSRAHAPEELLGIPDLRADDRVHRSLVADLPREKARVDALDADDAVALEPGSERLSRSPVAGDAGELAHDEPREMRLRGLVVLVVDAVVPDQRVRHHHDLAAVGRVGQDLLIAGEARVEHDLAERLATRADGR